MAVATRQDPDDVLEKIEDAVDEMTGYDDGEHGLYIKLLDSNPKDLADRLRYFWSRRKK